MHGITIVELGGEKRTLAFNMHFFQFLCKQLKCNPDEVIAKLAEVGTEYPLRSLTIVIYCGLIGFLETEAIYIHDITLKQVSKWVGEANVNEFQSVWDTFSEIMEIPKASQEQIDAYVKKHAPKEKKKTSK